MTSTTSKYENEEQESPRRDSKQRSVAAGGPHTARNAHIDLTGTPSPKKEHQGKEWCLTIHYRTAMAIATTDAIALRQEKLVDRQVALWLIEQINLNATYSVFGDEVCPKTGQQHFQGYVIFKHRQRESTIRKKFHKTIHWEAAKGNWVENLVYCTKSDTSHPNEIVLTHGKEPEFTDNGEREKSRWKKARLNAQAGKFDDIDDQIYVQNYKNLLAIRAANICDTEWLKEMPGHWLYGVSGSGKTFKARTAFPGRVYLKQLNKWWCGYEGEENVVLEDLDQSHAFLLYYIKIWIDIYPFAAEYKGGHVKQIRPKRIIITSNHAIKDVFKLSDVLNQEDQIAIQRRFHVEHFPFVHPDVKLKLSQINSVDVTNIPEAVIFNLAPVPLTPITPIPLQRSESGIDQGVFKAEDYVTPPSIPIREYQPEITLPLRTGETPTQPMSEDEEEEV